MKRPEYISKTKIEYYSSLDSSKMRRRKRIFAVEGMKSIADILPAYKTVALIIEDDFLNNHSTVAGNSSDSNKNNEDLLSTIMEAFPFSQIRIAGKADMKRLSSLSTPPPAIAFFEIPEFGNEQDSVSELNPEKLYLLLDGVRDPGNMGTIIRTADWFGVHTIFASHDSTDIYNQKVIQATMGSLAHVKVYYCNLPELAKKNSQLPLFGTLLNGENIYDRKLPDRGLIVMGNEGKGISEEMRELIQNPLTIPPYNSIHGESLNVAVATAVILSEFRREALKIQS